MHLLTILTIIILKRDLLKLFYKRQKKHTFDFDFKSSVSPEYRQLSSVRLEEGVGRDYINAKIHFKSENCRYF